MGLQRRAAVFASMPDMGRLAAPGSERLAEIRFKIPLYVASTHVSGCSITGRFE